MIITAAQAKQRYIENNPVEIRQDIIEDIWESSSVRSFTTVKDKNSSAWQGVSEELKEEARKLRLLGFFVEEQYGCWNYYDEDAADEGRWYIKISW